MPTEPKRNELSSGSSVEMATNVRRPARLALAEICWLRHARDNGVQRQCSGCREFHSEGWLGCTHQRKRSIFYCQSCRVLVDTGELYFNGQRRLDGDRKNTRPGG